MLSMANNRVLIIDDDLEIQNAYRSVLAPEDKNSDNSDAGAQLAALLGAGHAVDPTAAPRFELGFAAQGPEGVDMVTAALTKKEPFGLAFIDIRMPPGFDGMETAARIRRIDPNIEIVMVTAYSDRSREEIVRTVGTPEKLLLLRKPFDPEELIQLALSLTTKWNLGRHAEEQKDALETVLRTTPAAIFTVDEKRCITSWNPAAENITGYTASEVIGQPCILQQLSTEKICGTCSREVFGATGKHFELTIIDSKGRQRTLLKNSTCIKDDQGHIVRIVESFWDITERKAAEAALTKSEARFRALVETTSDWVWETDADGRFTYCSPLCETIYGYSPNELLDSSLFDLIVEPVEHDESRTLFNRCVAKKESFHNIERCIHTKKGRAIHIESSGMPVLDDDGRIIGFRGIDRNITQRKIIENERLELETQYRQSQKLEALGTLAGGIAHDLNNVLTPIMGSAELSLMQLDSDHPIHDNLKAIVDSAQRAAELVHQILAFSRKQVMAVKPLNLNTLINNFSAMLRRLIREDIHLSFTLDDALWFIKADKNQMEQILINLVVNARDAVSEGGEMIIKTANHVEPEHGSMHREHQLVPGPYVVLSVSDNGTGIEQEVLERIFDPFYTTKETGKGTGLGLSTVYGIVKQHDGDILVDTAPGKGTHFSIYFKKSEDGIETDGQADYKAVSGGKETILLVEDDLGVRALAVSCLKLFGYRVIVADNGIEAIEIFKKQQDQINLLFTDVIMPGMGGKSLAKTLRQHKPDLPVLFMSGHAFDINTKELSNMKGNDFIQKPFTPREVARKTRYLLDNLRTNTNTSIHHKRSL